MHLIQLVRTSDEKVNGHLYLSKDWTKDNNALNALKVGMLRNQNVHVRDCRQN